MAKQRIIAITGASGGLAQEIVKQLSPSDLDTQVPHGLGSAGVLHAL